MRKIIACLLAYFCVSGDICFAQPPGSDPVPDRPVPDGSRTAPSVSASRPAGSEGAALPKPASEDRPETAGSHPPLKRTEKLYGREAFFRKGE